MKKSDVEIDMDTTRRKWTEEISNANMAARQANAVRTAPDGFQYLDIETMGEDFARYYKGLVSVGFARGWL